MRLLLAVLAVLAFLPMPAASADDLDELLDEAREASYTAEQLISCATPDGPRDLVVRVAQSAGEVRVGRSAEDIEVAAGAGGWTVTGQDGVVRSVSVSGAAEPESADYEVARDGPTTFLSREASTYTLSRDGIERARLVVDDETGAFVEVTSLGSEGEVYCRHRFISFEPGDPGSPAPQLEGGDGAVLTESDPGSLPEEVAGFARLDVHEDDQGLRLAYYSDGFFSFAVFETPAPVRLPNGSSAEIGGEAYLRSFAPGQASYAWETGGGGMALVGDIPPDMHPRILAEMPAPAGPGWMERIWRRLFG